MDLPHVCEVSSWDAFHFWDHQTFLCVPDPVDLGPQDVPDSGYISPELVVTCLCMLTLASKYLGSGLILIHLTLASTSASILPALTSFSVGDSEYLEDVAAHIHAPQLHWFHIHFFCRVDFNTPQLVCD